MHSGSSAALARRQTHDTALAAPEVETKSLVQCSARSVHHNRSQNFEQVLDLLRDWAVRFSQPAMSAVPGPNDAMV